MNLFSSLQKYGHVCACTRTAATELMSTVVLPGPEDAVPLQTSLTFGSYSSFHCLPSSDPQALWSMMNMSHLQLSTLLVLMLCIFISCVCLH